MPKFCNGWHGVSIFNSNNEVAIMGKVLIGIYQDLFGSIQGVTCRCKFHHFFNLSVDAFNGKVDIKKLLRIVLLNIRLEGVMLS